MTSYPTSTNRRPSPAVTAGRAGERGAALAIVLILLALLAAISISVLAVATSEIGVTGNDLCRTQTFYAAAAGIEKMTSDFSAVFARTSSPPQTRLDEIALDSPPELVGEGFSFQQSLQVDQETMTELRERHGLSDDEIPQIHMNSGPYAGLFAGVVPYKVTSIARQTSGCGAEVSLERRINNFLIPIFQFGMFSDKDIELHPGPSFTFNGRVHANGNIYLHGGNTGNSDVLTLLAKVTTASELVRDVLRNGNAREDTDVRMQVGNINVPVTVGSVNGGPDVSLTDANLPDGAVNANWATTSVAAPRTGDSNRFGGQLQTKSTGAVPLLLPLQLDDNPTEDNPTREIIKRRMSNDDDILSNSRYHTKAQIRILLDDEPGTLDDGVKPNADTDASGIVQTQPAARQGVLLSQFTPRVLGTGGRALYRINDNGTYADETAANQIQQGAAGTTADSVRGVKSVFETPAGRRTVPNGAGLRGRILIEIVDGNGNARDVTQTILSMGVTVGEPNAIVHLQRPLWAAYMQGSRDATGDTSSSHANHLVRLTDPARLWAADGEVKAPTSSCSGGEPCLHPTYGFFMNIQEDDIIRQNEAPAFPAWNSIVPINVYNVREGRINDEMTANEIYTRGITGVVEINMHNLTRWLDGVYDGNLLNGTDAVSGNVNSADGYILYISDRRGDRLKTEGVMAGTIENTTNGMVDNEDIYGPKGQNNYVPNAAPDPGEDVIDAGRNGAGVAQKGSLQRDVNELPDPASFAHSCGTDRICRAREVSNWRNTANYFRRAVRLFNGEDLLVNGPANRLSQTKGITVATENMVYIWGNYNTTGINARPPAGTSALNDSDEAYYYNGEQVPASIVSDAFFPLSKTWFDASAAMYPDSLARRPADLTLDSSGNAQTAPATQETSVRAGIISGNNLSAFRGTPDAGNGADSRLSGGIHNFPRFLENWLSPVQEWNFVGSFVPLYHSTQALGPWIYPGSSTKYAYLAPLRDWAFDITFTDPQRLPPGTPAFQYIEPTGFKQVVTP